MNINLLYKKLELLVDCNGQNIELNDYVVIENNDISHIYRFSFSPQKLAFGFVALGKQERFFTIEKIRKIYKSNFNITKLH